MRVAHISNSAKSDGGGVSVAMLDLVSALSKNATETEVHALDTPGENIPSPGVTPQFHNVSGKFPFPSSINLLKYLAGNGVDLMHVHGLWSYPSLAIPKAGRKSGTPWISSPHGMLDPWALRNSRWKKQIASLLFENRHLRNASCLHALCASEADTIKDFGVATNVCVIPNGVQLPTLDPATSEEIKHPKILLFLGRLHPKKGLENALRAWRSLQDSKRNDWIFVIAGWDQGGHGEQLKELCSELEIPWNDRYQGRDFLDMISASTDSESEVFFSGPFFGKEKEGLLQTANAFILPSFSEGLPMAVLEAWAYELPVILTKHCNLEQGLERGAAISVETDPKSIAHGLDEMFSLSDSQRIAMGKAGHGLVANDFSWDSVANEMKSVYVWILGGGPAPSCVMKH